MTTYAIFIRDKVRDQSEFAVYGSKAGATLAGHDAKALVAYGPLETLEGAEAEGVVMIEFPSREAAKAWYQGPAYQEVIKHRHLSADYRVIFADGL